MARIAEAVRPSAAQRSENERRAIEECEREIEGLRTAHATALLADDPADADKLAEQIAKAERRLSTRRDRLGALHGLNKRELAAQRQRDKDAALVTFEQGFSARVTAAARVDKAVAELAASLSAYRAACRVPFEVWPATFPDRKLFDGAAFGFIDSRIAHALHMRSPGAAFTLLTALPGRLGSQEEQDIKLAASLVEDVRKSPIPGQPEQDLAA
jgi:hypothetical protein